MNKVKYTPMSREVVIPQSENSQLRVQVFSVDNNRNAAFMSLTVWNRYLTRQDKNAGIQRADAPFRPDAGKNMSFPLEDVEDVVEAIRDLKLEFLDNG